MHLAAGLSRHDSGLRCASVVDCKVISLKQEQEWREWYLEAEDALRLAADGVLALWETDCYQASEALGELLSAGVEAHKVWERRRVAYEAFAATVKRQGERSGLTDTWLEALGG
jgi:hypothetical protein